MFHNFIIKIQQKHALHRDRRRPMARSVCTKSWTWYCVEVTGRRMLMIFSNKHIFEKKKQGPGAFLKSPFQLQSRLNSADPNLYTHYTLLWLVAYAQKQIQLQNFRNFA